MRIRRIEGTWSGGGKPEIVAVRADGETIYLVGEGLNADDVFREMRKMRDEGYKSVGVPVEPPEDGLPPELEQ